MLQQERMSREESAQITPRCFRFHVSCSLRKPVRVLRLGVKIHRKGIFLDKHIWNQIARCSAHGSLLGMVGGVAMQPRLSQGPQAQAWVPSRAGEGAWLDWSHPSMTRGLLWQ